MCKHPLDKLRDVNEAIDCYYARCEDCGKVICLTMKEQIPRPRYFEIIYAVEGLGIQKEVIDVLSVGDATCFALNTSPPNALLKITEITDREMIITPQQFAQANIAHNKGKEDAKTTKKQWGKNKE